MARIEGSCLCGKISYSASADPVFTGVCHCKNCQKSTGSAFGVVVGVPKAALTVRGAPKIFEVKGDSGSMVEYHFCPDCGSAVMTSAAMMPDLILIAAGTLDDSSWVRPTNQIFCESAQPWVKLGGEMKSFAKMPTPG